MGYICISIAVAAELNVTLTYKKYVHIEGVTGVATHYAQKSSKCSHCAILGSKPNLRLVSLSNADTKTVITFFFALDEPTWTSFSKSTVSLLYQTIPTIPTSSLRYPYSVLRCYESIAQPPSWKWNAFERTVFVWRRLNSRIWAAILSFFSLFFFFFLHSTAISKTNLVLDVMVGAVESVTDKASGRG